MNKNILLSTLVLSGILLISEGCGPGVTGIPTVPAQVIGHCVYMNNFSGMSECRDYLGAGWTAETVTADCQRRSSAAIIGSACNYPSTYGQCILDWTRPNVTRLTFPGSDMTKCGSVKTGCEFWGGGVFVASNLCGGVASEPPVMMMSQTVFRQPVLECKEPIAGEPAGMSEGGRVCTWAAISACTEPGRKYADYGRCENVLTQRPYYPVARAPARSGPDPRLQDPAYVAELNWARSQIESCACVCCHSSRTAPRGTSNWFVEAEGNFMDSFFDSGLALGAGWVDSASFGAYPPAENHGFSRDVSGFPTTDSARMVRFFEGELAARGRTRESFAGVPPFGGPIYTQSVYQPTACTMGEGVAANGTVTWRGGNARYVYVLEAGSRNPGVPPNLDTPVGTVWRVDVPFDGTAIASGITYGQVAAGITQKVPAMGAPPALTAGRQYYLFVLQDVGIPITRCLFTAQ